MKHALHLPGGLARSAGTLTATAILVFALVIAVTGAIGTRGEINASFQQQRAIAHAQFSLEQMLKMQLDEENYLRAYVITRDPSYVESFHATSARQDQARAELALFLHQQSLTDAEGALLDYDVARRDWQAQIAQPLLRHPSGAPARLDKRGKILVDTQSEAARFVERRLDDKEREVAASTQAQVDSTLYARVVWLIAFGVLAILLNAFRWRARADLEDERLTTKTLQRAFRSEHVPLPNCTIGSAYTAASRQLAVGGDVFDVHRLSDRLALVLIADVSGKGVDAAVLTAFIKFTIRGIALRRRDPAYILQEFNRAFPRTVNNPSLFVSMFVGILDTWTLRMDYASAGHEPIFLRRGERVEQLAVTGPLLGIMEEPFDSRTVYLRDGELIVLATDGLTESRNNRGEMLDCDGAMRWIAEGSTEPSQLAQSLISRVRERSGRMSDDAAILAIRVSMPSTVPAPTFSSPAPVSRVSDA